MSDLEQRPYRLGITESMHQGARWIAVKGPHSVLDALASLPKADWCSADEGPQSFLMFPATRLNAMIAEAVATPAEVAVEYRHWRNSAMEPQLAWKYLSDAVIDGSNCRRIPLVHQTDFLAHLIGSEARGMINASEQGTGKTAVGWWSLCAWKAQRALIVCPKSLMREWEREWRAMWPGMAPVWPVVLDNGSTTKRSKILEGHTKYRQDGGSPIAVILNYEVVHALEKEILRYAPDCIVLDESFRVKNPDAQVTKSLIRIADRAEHVLELTGTPIGNHIGDLWSQLRLLGKEAMPEGYHAFLRKYAVLQSVQLGPRTIQKPVGIADPAGLMERLAPYWYRATKASCLHLPPKRYETVRLTMLRETRELYQAVKKNGMAALGNEMSLDSEAVVGIRLHQIAGGHEPAFDFQNEKCMMNEMRCLKIEWLKQFTKDQLEANPTSRCIVWARYTHELRRITHVLRAALGENRVQMCWGGTDNEELEAWKASFQSRSEEGVQVLVCQIKKMAFGHNLQACDTNIFFSNSWSYVERSQAEDRSHRNGRADAVRYMDLVLQGTIDEEIQAALAKKQDFAAKMSPDTSSPRSER